MFITVLKEGEGEGKRIEKKKKKEVKIRDKNGKYQFKNIGFFLYTSNTVSERKSTGYMAQHPFSFLKEKKKIFIDFYCNLSLVRKKNEKQISVV